MRIRKQTVVFGLVFILLNIFLAINALVYVPEARAAGETIIIQITGPAQPPGFLPALATVHVYDTVIFVNQTSPAISSSVVADDGAFSSPTIAPGKQWIVAFNTPGEHEYHTSSHSLRMVGVIIVVPNAVSLLPTPAPGMEATVITMIKAGKTPPDTLLVPTPTPTLKHSQTALATSPFNGWLLPVLLIAGTILILLGLATGGFYGFRFLRKQLRKHKERHDDEDNEDDDDEDD